MTVVSYGSPIWLPETQTMEVFNSPGPYNTARLTGVLVDPRGKLLLAFLKWTLGINRKTSNAPIWDDCSRLPLVLKIMGQMFNYINDDYLRYGFLSVVHV